MAGDVSLARPPALGEDLRDHGGVRAFEGRSCYKVGLVESGLSTEVRL